MRQVYHACACDPYASDIHARKVSGRRGKKAYVSDQRNMEDDTGRNQVNSRNSKVSVRIENELTGPGHKGTA